MASINQQNTRHANLARIIVDKVVLAECQNVSVSEDGGTAPVRVVGTAYAVEHIHNAVTVQGNIGALMWYSTRLKKLDLGNGELIKIPVFDIEALDERTNEVIFVVRQVTLAGRSLQIAANQPLQKNVQFQGILVDVGDGAARPDESSPGTVLV